MPEPVRESALAASAMALARSIDNKATAPAVKELRETLAALKSIEPAKPEEDELDRIRGRRQTRRGA